MEKQATSDFQRWSRGHLRNNEMQDSMYEHHTDLNLSVKYFVMSALAAIGAWIAKAFLFVSPIIGGITVLLSFGAAIFAFYNGYHAAKKNWNARKRRVK